MTTPSRSLATALSKARSLAACSAELHHRLGQDLCKAPGSQDFFQPVTYVTGIGGT
jgi:hypothetical protein